MARSFKSSKSITNESRLIFSYLNADYWAHTHEQKPPERLLSHTNLVGDYLIQIIDAHGLEAVMDGLISSLCHNTHLNHDTAGNFIKEIVVNSIFLHDIGKINPNFQVERMKNPAFAPMLIKIKHQHSLLGAYLFCNYYFAKIFSNNQLNDTEKNTLYFITFCFANPIIKHHSTHVDFIESFDSKLAEINECFSFLKAYHIEIDAQISQSFFENYQSLKDQFVYQSTNESFLNIYILIKLSFSLLTASDFYATNEFMGNLRISEFGVIDDKLREHIRTQFWSAKEYNANLSKTRHLYLSSSFDDLSEVNRENLNILRQKLTAEVLGELQRHLTKRWYYIEAPTGSGKTNLSLACVAELLDADRSLNKVFYVHPFTTLITQTFKSIKETIGLSNNEVVQFHSKIGLHHRAGHSDQDAKYGDERTLYLDHIFANYPFVVLSHVKFFEIVKGNEKTANYIFHRLCNSIVVIDELQAYDPKHWDKVAHFITHYAEILNMRFIIMSATLPKIDILSRQSKGKFVSLIQNRDNYFQNRNFMSRVKFDFSLIDELRPFKTNKDEYFLRLSARIRNEAEQYATINEKVRVIVEFITKNSASKFLSHIVKSNIFSDYQIYILTGDILEPRRRQVIHNLSEDTDKKVLLISTQVVEAGVDIDMDLGFKNRAILDSDEQLAGRVNRNASKNGCKVFLFELDNIKTIYGKDERYKQQQLSEYINENWKRILVEKKFHELYERVFEVRSKPDWTDGSKFDCYMQNFRDFDLDAINRQFTLIGDNRTETVFIPKDIDIPQDIDDSAFIKDLDVLNEEGKISGEKVYDLYTSILIRECDFLKRKIDLKKLAGLMSMFTISMYPNAIRQIGARFDTEKEKYGFKYLASHDIYSYEYGFDMGQVTEDIFM